MRVNTRSYTINQLGLQCLDYIVYSEIAIVRFANFMNNLPVVAPGSESEVSAVQLYPKAMQLHNLIAIRKNLLPS